MPDVVDVLADVILPVVLVAALGGIVADRIGMPVRPLSQLTFYFFSPALVFSSLASVELGGSEATRIVVAFVATWLAAAALAYGFGALRGHDRAMRSAMALTAAQNNGGNMGLPVALLAFGETGLEIAVVAFVASAVLGYTLAIALAAMAGGDTLRGAGAAPLRIPAIWMAVVGLAVNMADIDLPTMIDASTTTAGDAAIPVMLVVLGLQMRRPLGFDGGVVDVATATLVRLVGAPLLAWLFTELAGVDGVAQRTLVVVCGMPTAVLTTVLATQYDAKPSFVTRVVLVSTFASVVTLTVLVALLR